MAKRKKTALDGSVQTTNSTSCSPTPARRMKQRHRHRRHPWSDIPHDLLGDVLQRLPSFADRVRFRGVCRSWRAAERAHPRPPMPWLVFPGHCVSFHDAAIYRSDALSEKAARAATCRGSFHDWIALVPRSNNRRPFLLNTFTKARIRLPQWKTSDDSIITKIIMSTAPDSENCTIAALVDHGVDGGREIIVCRQPVQSENCFWWSITCTKVLMVRDIAFFQGNLHALDIDGCIHVFRDGGDLEQLNQAQWTAAPDHVMETEFYKLYMVTLPARLLLVCRQFGTTHVPGTRRRYTCGLKMFELDDDGEIKRESLITNLDGHAVFLGDACATAFPITADSSRIKQNQVCFVDDERSSPLIIDVVPAGTSTQSRPVVGGHRPLRLQSYDVSTYYLRTYQHPLEPWPAASTTTGTRWPCISVKRLHTGVLQSATPETEYGYQLLLREVVVGCLGGYVSTKLTATGRCRHGQHDCHVVAVQVGIPRRAGIGWRQRHNHWWSFVKCSSRSVRKAKQAAAYDAVTFLRGRFSDVLDDSPWSSIPSRSRHEEIEEEVVNDSSHSSDDEIDSSRRWFQ